MMQSLRRCKQRASITLGWQRALRCVAFIAWRLGPLVKLNGSAVKFLMRREG